jgi:hypothetical protein
MAANLYASVSYSPAAGSSTFAMTTSGGQKINYLSLAHIHVSRNNVELARPSQWDMNSSGAVVLKTPTTAGDTIKIQRITPLDDLHTTFSRGTILAAQQLQDAQNFALFINQETRDLLAASQARASAIAALDKVVPFTR